jgi:hypothetical protein
MTRGLGRTAAGLDIPSTDTDTAIPPRRASPLAAAAAIAIMTPHHRR